jgi:hypothetical protein
MDSLFSEYSIYWGLLGVVTYFLLIAGIVTLAVGEPNIENLLILNPNDTK